MKKICFITYQFKTGGVERIFIGISKHLNAEISLITVTNNYDEIKNEIPPNVNFINIHDKTFMKFIHSISNKFHFFKPIEIICGIIYEIFFLRFSSQYKNYIFVNFADTISSLLVTYLSASKKSNRYSWIHYNPNTIDKSNYAKLYKYVYKKMCKIVCICYEQKEIMKQVIPQLKEEQLTVIYNIIDINEIIKRKNDKIPYMQKYILMVARFDFRSKDFYTLINAYSELPEDLKTRYQLLLLGDGPDMEKVKRYVYQKNEEKNVILLGKDNNPYKWMARADILILSSKSEGLPTVLIESMICNTPVISTICQTGPREILNNGEYGILVPVGDSNILKRSIIKLLNDENLRNTFIQKANENIYRFSPDSIIPKINNLWKDK